MDFFTTKSDKCRPCLFAWQSFTCKGRRGVWYPSLPITNSSSGPENSSRSGAKGHLWSQTQKMFNESCNESQLVPLVHDKLAHDFTFKSISLSAYLSICLSVYLSICLSFCLSISLSICLSIEYHIIWSHIYPIMYVIYWSISLNLIQFNPCKSSPNL